jgi:proteasome lid subunit RPN8/RPN11
MSAEVCGVLIGDLSGDLPEDGGEVKIFAAIAGENAAQAGTHVTFTQDAWEHIYKVKDAEYPEARIVGWYHSHPGFGVFLSEHDTFIQENFFSAAGQVAWVFDPHTDEEGCFGWVDGSIARLDSITVVDSNGPGRVSESRELAVANDGEEKAAAGKTAAKRRKKRPRMTQVAMVLAVLVALGLGFMASRMFFPSIYPLLVPVNPIDGRPLLHDPVTGETVYLDPQARRYVVPDARTGRLRQVDPSKFATGAPPAASLPGTVPSPGNQTAPKEKK